MRRRRFLSSALISLLPVTAAFGQAVTQPRVVLLSNAREGDALQPAFERDILRGLAQQGLRPAEDFTFETRWSGGDVGRLRALAQELVQHGPTVIIAAGGDVVARELKAATSSVPVVFVLATDPVRSGLVQSLNRPGGNMTGVYRLSSSLNAKRAEMLMQLVPHSAKIGVLVQVDNPSADIYVAETSAPLREAGKSVQTFALGRGSSLDQMFDSIAANAIDAVAITTDPILIAQVDKLADLTRRKKIPAIYEPKSFVRSGGLMSYGADLFEAYAIAGNYAGRIIKGESPAVIPITQPIRIELSLNLRTARELGIEIPTPLLARADEVVE